MKEFVFNDCDVCTNCNMIERWHEGTYFSISTAIGRNGRWVYGYSCWLRNGGTGSPCADKAEHYDIPSFATEQEAIREAGKQLKAYFLSHATTWSASVPDEIIKNYSPALMRLLDEVVQPQPVQLALFD